jgi:hypothetical protein
MSQGFNNNEWTDVSVPEYGGHKLYYLVYKLFPMVHFYKT